MLTPLQRFVVVHRHSPKDPPDYYGPFVSESKANEFADKFATEGRTFIRPLKSRQDFELEDEE